MLGILVMNLFILISPNLKNKSWYLSMWSFGIMSLISITHLFSPAFSYEAVNNLMSYDSMSTLLVCLNLWISTMMILASHQSVMLNNNSWLKFKNLIVIMSVILSASFLASSSISFYFLFEASLIPTLVLIIGWGYQPERLQAGMYMMIYTVGASLPLLMAILYMSVKFNSSEMLMVSSMRLSPVNGLDSWSWNFLTLLMFSAFLVKLPMFSVHLWLPKAHVEAPVAGSMVLAAVLLKLGGYGILRFCQFFNFSFTSVSVIMVSLAVWGGMITSIICFRQVDLKSLIAYSSVGHMALMLLGAFSNCSWGWNGALVLMLSHGFCSSALFSLANFTYEKTFTRSMYLTKGMLMLIPSLALWWFLFCVMNMAAPPSINLLGEIMIFPSAMFISKYLMLPLGFMSFLAALYSMFLFTSVHHGGSPKFNSPFTSVKSNSFLLLLAHWIPSNILILKSDLVASWI